VKVRIVGGGWERTKTVKCRNYIDWVIAAIFLDCFDSGEDSTLSCRRRNIPDNAAVGFADRD
jgi:hypothetical protein